jgi:hypothetical protein
MMLAALAYIDPGSGALLWQAVLSAFFGGLFLARRALWRASTGIRRVLRGERKSSEAEPGPSNDEPKSV